MKKYMIISLVPLALLSACSVATSSGNSIISNSSHNATKASTSTSTFSKLQQEYKQHTYSAYVGDNLKASPVIAQSSQEILINEKDWPKKYPSPLFL